MLVVTQSRRAPTKLQRAALGMASSAAAFNNAAALRPPPASASGDRLPAGTSDGPHEPAPERLRVATTLSLVCSALAIEHHL